MIFVLEPKYGSEYRSATAFWFEAPFSTLNRPT
jgi:hypothetical protein